MSPPIHVSVTTMRVTIHQPQFLPWLGYLDKIDRSDCFVILDTVQFKKNEWQNRNRLRTAQGWQWMTVPVHHKFGQPIHDIRINHSVDWRHKHLRAIEMHYGRAPYRDHFLPKLLRLYDYEWERLPDFNLACLRWLMDAMGITTPILLASHMKLRHDPTERLIDICRTVGATTYLAGAGAKGYMDLSKFEESGMQIEFQNFQHPWYAQCYSPFLPGMAAMDLLFTCGPYALQCLRGQRADHEHVSEMVAAMSV